MWPLAILLGLTTVAVLAHRSGSATAPASAWAPVDPRQLPTMGLGRYRFECLIAPVVGLPSSQDVVNALVQEMQAQNGGALFVEFLEEGPMPGTGAIFFYPPSSQRPADWPPPQMANESLLRLQWEQRTGIVGSDLPGGVIRAWKYVG